MWKQIERAPDYDINEQGQIRRIRGNLVRHNPIIQTSLCSDGYPVLRVRQNGKTKYFKVHILLMEAFGPPKPFPGAIVRHLDDIRTNNTLSNLAWGSFQDNTDDFKRNNPETYADGKLFPRQKLTLAQVTQIRELLKAKVPLKRLGRMFGVDRTSIRDIRDGRSYRNT